MKLTAIILFLVSLLIITGCSQGTQQPLGVVATLTDLQNDYYNSEASPEYWTYTSGTLNNSGNTTITKTVTLTYGNSVELGEDDIKSLAIVDGESAGTVGSGNYTLKYQTGNLTLDEYQVEKLTVNEQILCTNASGGRNVTQKTYGVVSGSLNVLNESSNVTLGTGNYTFDYDIGNLLCVSGSAYVNKNVSVNYSYYNATWIVNATFVWYNKLKINCTPAELDSGTIDAFIKEIKFLELGSSKRVQLWIGDYVVNDSDGGAKDANNIFGDGWYVNNATGLDTLTFGKPTWANDEQFVLRIDDPASLDGTVKVNVLCKYRIR